MIRRRLACWMIGHHREDLIWWSHCSRCGRPISEAQKTWYREQRPQ